MQSNKRAFSILFMLVFTSLIIFCAEKKFLVAEKRGSALSKYAKLPWADKILFLVEDLEEIATDSALQQEHFFAYGSAKIGIDNSHVDEDPMAGKAAIRVNWDPTDAFGGWGKGVGENLDLNTETDHVNFRVLIPKTNGESDVIKIILEEDDNNNATLEKDKDDEWFTQVTVPASDQWQLISLPLKDFTDANEGGDHVLNITRKGGLHTIIFSMMKPGEYTRDHHWYFDFIFFSNAKIEDKDKKITNSLN